MLSLTVVSFTCVNSFHCLCRKLIFVAGCFFTVTTVSLRAQLITSSQPTNDAAYLMRLERVRRGLDLCVMVRGNGEYHLERHTSDKARIFEGNLNADETRQLIRIVSADQLYDLEQTQISDPMLRSEFDQVFLSVLRPIDSWQKLSFPDPQSREPYRESLVPLLDWLDKLQKHNASELPEVTGRNNCLPPRDLELRQRVQIGQNPPALSPGHGTAQATPHLPQLGTRSAQDPATTRQPYILKIQEGRFGWKKTTLSCAIISASGKYHLVKQTEDSGSSKVRSAVLDGTLDEKQIAALRQILDAPELRSASSEKPPPVFTSPLEGRKHSHCIVILARGDGLQE